MSQGSEAVLFLKLNKRFWDEILVSETFNSIDVDREL